MYIIYIFTPMISVNNLGEYFSFVIYNTGTNNNIMCLFLRALYIYIYEIRDFSFAKVMSATHTFCLHCSPSDLVVKCVLLKLVKADKFVFGVWNRTQNTYLNDSK